MFWRWIFNRRHRRIHLVMAHIPLNRMGIIGRAVRLGLRDLLAGLLLASNLKRRREMEQINTALNQDEVEFIDGALEVYSNAVLGLRESQNVQKEIQELRLKLNRSLTCEAPECNRHRVGMDRYCGQCEVFPVDHAQLCSAR